jgi:hypothetical protein
VWFRNIGTKAESKLAAARAVVAAAPRKPAWTWWNPTHDELVTQWRTTPLATDWDGDGLMDLVMLDDQGYLALFPRERRNGELVVLAARRIFETAGAAGFDRRNAALDPKPGPLRLNAEWAGKSGRRKLALVDWDGDGRRDLLVNSVSVDWFRNGEDGWTYQGPIVEQELAGHTTSPTTVDWDGDGVRDLLVGAEDGFLYYAKNPRGALARGAAIGQN